MKSKEFYIIEGECTMKLVMVERDSVGLDVNVDGYKDFGEVTYYPHTTLEEGVEHIGDAEVVISNKLPLNETTLKDCPNVKLICNTATGFDNIDLDYCNKRGIRVTNVKDYSTAAVAQHTFALLFYVLEKLRGYDDYVKSGEYTKSGKFSYFGYEFTELEGRTWGIVGMGNIGRKVAKIAEAFGCRVIFYSSSGNSTCTEYERVDFDTLLKESDFLSLHCPLTDRTRDLMNKEAFSKMKKEAILINVARGPVVNQEALYEALSEGMIAGAGLDVLTKEPMTEDNPLAKIKDSHKLLITPHMAWGSVEARQRVVDGVYKNIEAYLNGEKRNVVNEV